MKQNEDIKKRIELQFNIIKRYEKLKLDDIADPLSLIMDLEYSNVNLEKLYATDDKTLLHDVNGIICNMDRKNKILVNFVPRVGFQS